MTTAYTPPTTMHEFVATFQNNIEIGGTGPETYSATPCPFCAAPRFQVRLLAHPLTSPTDEATCDYCHRSGKWLIDADPTLPSEYTYEFVQTGGDDVPAWFEHPPRRISIIA